MAKLNVSVELGDLLVVSGIAIGSILLWDHIRNDGKEADNKDQHEDNCEDGSFPIQPTSTRSASSKNDDTKSDDENNCKDSAEISSEMSAADHQKFIGYDNVTAEWNSRFSALFYPSDVVNDYSYYGIICTTINEVDSSYYASTHGTPGWDRESFPSSLPSSYEASGYESDVDEE